MESVRSRDGTPIAFERSGSGPALVLVHGSAADHTRWNGILPELAERLTVMAMDRRGRGGSGDTERYSIEFEYDDVAAVVASAGSDACLLGHSFGALCCMEAALKVNNLSRMVLYEPPFPVGGAKLYPQGMAEKLASILDRGDRDELLTTFFSDVVGTPMKDIAMLRSDPSWPARLSAAHTIVREMADGDYVFEPDRFHELTVPTLILVGETSPATLKDPARRLDAALPNSRLITLEGQGHIAMTTAPKLFLQTVLPFLLSGDQGQAREGQQQPNH